jgi:hypothetical protein
MLFRLDEIINFCIHPFSLLDEGQKAILKFLREYRLT